MRITAISDTHMRHKKVNLPGGDLILCSGDISSRGFFEEIKSFCKWFEVQRYDSCVFIAGNHDFGFQDHKQECEELLKDYAITYLEDSHMIFPEEEYLYDESITIYGSPWQPEFYNWAFNLPRNGWELEQKWNDIPENTDILLTHGPPYGILDVVKGRTDHLGCELLIERLKIVKPKIHIFGHIHTGYGYYFDGTTHFINASVLDEQYQHTQNPLTFDWDPITNELTFV